MAGKEAVRQPNRRSFMGWVLKSGARWSSECWVAPISALDKVSLKDEDGGSAVRPQRASSLWTTGGDWAICGRRAPPTSQLGGNRFRAAKVCDWRQN